MSNYKGGTNTKAVSKYHHYKECDKCGETKRLADFAIIRRKLRAANPKRYSRKCKECSRAPSATEVDPNFKPDRVNKAPVKKRSLTERRAYSAEYQRKARRAVRIKAMEYLADKGCCECGERDPRVLEFDHIKPADKKHDICTLLGSGYSWASETLRGEIRKCRVLCANCHRLHTINQQAYYAHDDVQSSLRSIYEKHGIGE